MLIDGLELLESSTITNLVVPNGTAFPVGPDAPPNEGELFYLTTAITGFTVGLYYYDGTAWKLIVNNAILGDVLSAGSAVLIESAPPTTNSTSIPAPINGQLVWDATGKSLYVYNIILDTWTSASQDPTVTAALAAGDTFVTASEKTFLNALTATSTEVNYLSGVTSAVQTQLNNRLPLAGGTMAGNIIIPTGFVVDIFDTPTQDTYAVNKAYVDSKVAGLTWKDSVKAASTGNLTLSGTQTVDGIALVSGDRVLVKNQTVTATNGIYIVSASAWTRSTDMDQTTPINELNSAAVFVEGGTVNTDSGWTQINNIVTLGTDAISFTQFTGAGGVIAGVGLSKNINTLSVLLGAGVAQLPTNEVGIDVYASGGLFLTVDGTASSTDTSAQLSLTKVGTAGTYTSVTTDAYGRIVSGSTASFQPVDADLTAIAALTGSSGFLKTNGSGTWTVDTSTYLTGNQSITLSGDVTGSGSTTITTTLATVSQAASGSFVKVTLDTKGRVTGNTPVVQADITNVLGAGSITNTMLANSAVGNLSGTNTGDETTATIKTKLGITTLSGSNTGDQTITLTGDVTGSGTGSFATTLANTAVTNGTYGSATHSSTFTVDTKGRLTAASSVTITPAFSSITGTPTTLAGYGITDAASTGSNTSYQLPDAELTSGTITLSGVTANQIIDTAAVTSFRTAKYLVQITNNSSYQTCEILVIHDGVNANYTEYAVLFTDVVLATFTATVSGGNLQLLTTPLFSGNTYKVVRTAINI